MHDDSVLVAVDDATRTPNFCTCGQYLAVVEAHDAMWLECPVYTRPSRLPASLAAAIRSIVHDRRFVIEIPEALRTAAPATAATSGRVTRSASAARA